MEIKALNYDSSYAKPVTVAIVDSGFSRIPKYATIVGDNPRKDSSHGNRILDIFTAPDKAIGCDNIKLYLSCYDEKEGYGGLVESLSQLPDCDILSISLAWKDDLSSIKNQLMRFKNIFVPESSMTITPYPSRYHDDSYGVPGVVCCSDGTSKIDDENVIRINPPIPWRGNSYAVPAAARILAGFGGDIDLMYHRISDTGSTGVLDMFSTHRDYNEKKICESCGRKVEFVRNEFADGGVYYICPKCGSIKK